MSTTVSGDFAILLEEKPDKAIEVVVNVHVSGEVIGLPAKSFTPVVTVAVYGVDIARLLLDQNSQF